MRFVGATLVDGTGADHSSLAGIAGLVAANLGRALDEGFTTCREMGGLDGGFARAVERGLVQKGTPVDGVDAMRSPSRGPWPSRAVWCSW
jgi:hypothetical protein